MFQQVFEV